MKRSLHLSTAAAVLTLITTAATESKAQVREGFALNRFDPSERGSEWFALDTLDLRGHARPALGLVLDWAHTPLAIYDQNGDSQVKIVSEQVYLHTGGTVVLWNRLRLGANAPIAVMNDGTTGVLNTTPPQTFNAPRGAGIGDVRLGGDVRLLGEYGDPITIALGGHFYLPTGSRDNYTGDETVRFQPRVSAAGDIGPFVYAAKVGVQIRPDDRSFGTSKLGSEILFGGAAGLRLADKKLVIGPELYGSTVFGEAFDRLSSPLEGIVGGHYTAGDFRFGLGGGLGLTRGFGSPVSRLLVNLEWAPQPEKKEAPPPPEEPNDRDHDGVLDKDDACPDEPGVSTDDPATNGCPKKAPEPDRDHDGILDKDDACPDEPGVKTNDPKTNGCPPDPDRDKDGIRNEVDACPDEPGKADPDPKKNGCPKAFIQGGQIRIIDQVKFATASAQIVKGKDSEEVLDAVLKVLNAHPEITKLRVEGHTDNRGAAAMNKKLSADRAASVVKWLTSKGIAASRLTSAGFGPERPLDTNDTEQGRQNNRRVEFHIEGGHDSVKSN